MMVDLFLICLVVGYGISLGISNTFYRVCDWFGKSIRQNSVGQILDTIWYSLIAYLCVKYFTDFSVYLH